MSGNARGEGKRRIAIARVSIIGETNGPTRAHSPRLRRLLFLTVGSNAEPHDQCAYIVGAVQLGKESK